MRDVLTFILAGGKGERLNPLTRDRAKPAVPFGGIYRIIDFTLSNCVNSGLRRIFVLTQYKSFSLQKHLMAGWNIFSSELGEFIDIVPAQQRISSDWYRGTADAIYQNIYSIYDHDPDLVMILSGDHIYKMDYRKMIAYHKEHNAEMTVACIEMPAEDSKHFGVIEVDSDDRVVGFQEKPAVPRTLPADPTKIFASMGIYLFNRDVLVSELEKDANSSSDHDFGKNIIPKMIDKNAKVMAYNFGREDQQNGYWRDIGTRDAYYQANMDLVGDSPSFNVYDKQWRVRTYHEQFPPSKISNVVSAEGVQQGMAVNSLISSGAVVEGGVVEHSVLSPNVYVKSGAHVKNSVLMDGVVIGHDARVQNAIIDKDVVISNKEEIGFDLILDRKRFDVTASGIVIVAKKTAV